MGRWRAAPEGPTQLGGLTSVPTLVQSLAVPKPDSSLSAVVVSGGKQYRVAPGDKILGDRLTAEPRASLKLRRGLRFNQGQESKAGDPGDEGLGGEAKQL